jgi:glycosyl hydrolase family 113
MHRRSIHLPTALRRVLARALLAPLLLTATAGAAPPEGLRGFNVIVTSGHPFGGASAGRALDAAKRLGATAVAIIPFLWQPSPSSSDIVRGTDLPDDALRTALRQARARGLAVIVKPHVWVPESWAGAVAPTSEDGWRAWFAAYRRAIEPIARIAGEEHADAFAIGTELTRTTGRGEWVALIASARAAFPGTLLYVAHNADEAEAVPFWSLLDAIGVTLYPPLGVDGDRAGRIAAMRAEAERLDAVAARASRPVIVAEIGLRSAQGATAKPWESAEERAAPADAALQAQVLADWLGVLDRPAIRGVLIWRWFTDPDAGGVADTDFTVQGKPAEGVLRCAWARDCGKP